MKIYLSERNQSALAELEHNSKRKMAAVLEWYFVKSARLALSGDPELNTDYRVHCGLTLGAFNQRVKNGPLDLWQNRRVADVADYMMEGAAKLMTKAAVRFGPAV